MYFDNKAPENEVRRLIDNSYLLIVKKLLKNDRT
jgi:predicted DNA-binding protein (MmcQ/YjbR family)